MHNNTIGICRLRAILTNCTYMLLTNCTYLLLTIYRFIAKHYSLGLQASSKLAIIFPRKPFCLYLDLSLQTEKGWDMGGTGPKQKRNHHLQDNLPISLTLVWIQRQLRLLKKTLPYTNKRDWDNLRLPTRQSVVAVPQSLFPVCV